MSLKNEEYIELRTNETSYSKSECLKYQGIFIVNDFSKQPCHGEYSPIGFITRFKNGLLHGGKTVDGIDLPAYENEHGHVEYFENGLLHREGAPAVISNWGDWEEWWYYGHLILIRSFGTIEKRIIANKEEENEI